MNRPASVVPTNPVDAPIHGSHAGSSADKARQKASTIGLEGRKGSSQGGSMGAMSKPSPAENRGLSRSVQSATGGSSDQAGIESSKADSDELLLDSDFCA